MKTDNLTGKQDETSSNRQQELEPSTSQLKSSTFASLTVDNEHSDELSPSEDRMSNDQPRRAANVKENLQFLSNKFDFGDRDEKPTYNFTLPPLKENKGKEWTIDELKILHSCINSYGINDNCLFYATKNIPNRSMLDIREKISGIRELARLRQEMRAETRKNEWLKEVIVPSKTSEDYFGQEVKCRPASVDTRKYFRVTDSLSGRAANRRQVVDCADYYRFLQACLSGTTCGCKPFG
uniref:Myb-like domain-containing protein n=1 Tax=Setaria digitata TaxID=48799 RepID=A0A915PWN6_9BILA